jgi:nucleoid-associated protein YgaU
VNAGERGFAARIEVAKKEDKLQITNVQLPMSNEKEPVAAVAESREPEVIEYVVNEGDCLSRIAEKKLGNWYLYKKIAKENDIKNPDLIFPDQKLMLKK